MAVWNYTEFVEDLRFNNCTVYEGCEWPPFLYYVIIGGFLIVLGITGNTLTIITLFSDSFVNVTSLMLVVLAFCDSFVLLYQLFFNVLKSVCTYMKTYNMCSYLYYVYPYVNVYMRPFGAGIIYAAIWTILLLTVHRAIAILWPYKARRLATIGKVRIQIVIILLFSILSAVPMFFNRKVSLEPGCPPFNEVVPLKYYITIYANVYTNIFFNIGPLIMLIILTGILIHGIRKNVKQSRKMRKVEHEKSTYATQVIVILVTIVIIFIVCQTPRVVYIAAIKILGNEKMYSLRRECNSPWYKFINIIELLQILNSSINFFVYCVAGARFRQMVRSKFCPGLNLRKKQRSKDTAMTQLTLEDRNHSHAEEKILNDQ